MAGPMVCSYLLGWWYPMLTSVPTAVRLGPAQPSAGAQEEPFAPQLCSADSQGRMGPASLA